MPLRIFFAGLQPGKPLIHLAWAAFRDTLSLAERSRIIFGQELGDEFGRSWSVAGSITDSDVVVYPHPYQDSHACYTVAESARELNKPCLFFSQDERLPPSQLHFGTLYRSSIFERLPHERAHAVLINDVRQEVSEDVASLRAKEGRPRIGFCGYVGTPIRRAFLRFAGARQKVAGLSLRARVLRLIKKDPRLHAEFTTRAGYLGSATLAAFSTNHPLAEPRQAFLQNLFACPYGLAIRGKGNHSVRFYEILAAGRIPVFINTNCVLPFEHEIAWRKMIPWIDEPNLAAIGDQVLEFHDSLGADSFVRKQAELRTLWETRLKAIPYFRHILATVAAGKPAP